MSILLFKRLSFLSLMIGLFTMMILGGSIPMFMLGFLLFMGGLTVMITSFFFNNAEGMDNMLGTMTGRGVR